MGKLIFLKVKMYNNRTVNRQFQWLSFYFSFVFLFVCLCLCFYFWRYQIDRAKRVNISVLEPGSPPPSPLTETPKFNQRFQEYQIGKSFQNFVPLLELTHLFQCNFLLFYFPFLLKIISTEKQKMSPTSLKIKIRKL